MRYFIALFSLLCCRPMPVAASLDTAREEGRCLNLKGQNETCGLLEFCSRSSLEKGCRSCEEVALRWCVLGEERIREFQTRFPPCALSCQLLKCNRTTEELQATGRALSQVRSEMRALVKALNDTQENLFSVEQDLSSSKKAALQKDEEMKIQRKENDKVKEENNWLWISVGLLVAVVVMLAVALTLSAIYIAHCRTQQSHFGTAFTATPEKRTLWIRLMSGVPGCSGQDHQAVSTSEDEEPRQTTPTAPSPPESGVESQNNA